MIVLFTNSPFGQRTVKSSHEKDCSVHTPIKDSPAGHTCETKFRSHDRAACIAPAPCLSRRSAVKVADVERTLKRKVDCQVPSDLPAVLEAVNVGKPLSEAMPNSTIVKALRPLVAALDEPAGRAGQPAVNGSVLARFTQGIKRKNKAT